MNSPAGSQCVSTTLYDPQAGAPGLLVGVSRWLTRTERDGTISVAPAPLPPFGRATSGSPLPWNFSGTADGKQVRGFLVSRPMNTMTFADGACEGRSRNEEEVMQGHRRRRATQRSPATPISPKGGGGTASISLCSSSTMHSDIASSSLRELDAVALATNVMVFMGRDTSSTNTFVLLHLPHSCACSSEDRAGGS